MDFSSSHILFLQRKTGKRNRKLINTIAIFRLSPSSPLEKVNSRIKKWSIVPGPIHQNNTLLS